MHLNRKLTTLLGAIRKRAGNRAETYQQQRRLGYSTLLYCASQCARAPVQGRGRGKIEQSVLYDI